MSVCFVSRILGKEIPVIPILLCYIGVMSIVTFVMYGRDKNAARKSSRRTPEKTLFLMNFLGGAPGGWLGMYFFHHKTKHKSFYAVQFISALLWCCLIVFLILYL